METVIAIGVVAILITGFIAVFAPAVDGIRRSITIEEANRLTSTLERELVTLRPGETPDSMETGFEKAFYWILQSQDENGRDAVAIYQYRGDMGSQRPDGTPQPVTDVNVTAGTDFVTVSMARRVSDPLFDEDLEALEGRIFILRLTQLVYKDNALERGTPGEIVNPQSDDTVTNPDEYLDAVLSFAVDFFSVPSTSSSYFKSDAFEKFFDERMTRPIFSRNIAIRR